MAMDPRTVKKGADIAPEKLLEELEHLRRENTELRQQLGAKTEYLCVNPSTQSTQLPLISASLPVATNLSSIHEKISLFRALFKGRDDVYAISWKNERTGKKGYSPACEDPWSLRKGQPRKYLALTDQVIHDHLSGNKTIGIFPLLKENTCWFLACDFDREGWQLDAIAYINVCQKYRIPAYLERSRSGNGGHVWIFFTSPVPTTLARQLGMRLLRQTMDARADMDLGSYDRFFPSQDFVPRGGLGNLIAAPLQKKCRTLGNTEFLDTTSQNLQPWPDQWAFLSGVHRIASSQLEALLEIVPSVVIGPGSSEVVSDALRTKFPAPAEIHCEFGSSFSVEKSGIPPWMLSKLKHLASLHNPEFYLNQKLRLSTYRIPQFIKCYREDFNHIHMPRGIFEEIRQIVQQAGSKLVCTDRRDVPESLSLQFRGSLNAEQQKAIQITLTSEMGILVAPPGAGKTVMGCFAIAKRNLPTLILAHRKPILEQWRKHIVEHLGITSRQIGQIGGGRMRQSGVIDLAMIQSLVRMENLKDFFSKYGFIVVDECHHIPAATFEACIKEAPVRYLLGLTATPYRRDGLTEIIVMQCGPIRHRVSTPKSDIPKHLDIRETAFSYPSWENASIQEVFRAVVHSEERNTTIEKDVIEALAKGRRCLILSQWREHCQNLAERLTQRGKVPFVLNGAQGNKARATILKAIQESPPEKDLLVIATGQYLGEGFDCPVLDTLFLAFPVSFKGKLTQYIGRILRNHSLKNSVMVYDYFDSRVPVLKKMSDRRMKTYKAMGFIQEAKDLFS